MDRKKVMGIALIISAVFALLSVYWNITDPPAPQPQQPAMTQQNGSENLETFPSVSERTSELSGDTTSYAND
jgi:hypothetical protein